MVDAALGFLFPAVRTTLEFLFSEVVAQKKLVRQVKKEIGVLIHDRHPAGDVLENLAYPAWHRREMSESIQDINDIEDLRKVLGSAHGVRERLRRWAAFRDIGPDIDRIREAYKQRKDRQPTIQEAARADPVARAARAPPVARARLPGIDDDQLAIDCHKSGLKSMLACPTEAEAAGDGVASVEEHIRPIRLVSIVSDDADRSMTTEVAKGVFGDLKRHYAAAALVSVASASTSIGILRGMYHEVNPSDETDASLEWDEKRFMQEIRNVLENNRYLIIFIDTDEAAWIRVRHILNGCVPFEESNRDSNIFITDSYDNIFLSNFDAESRTSRGHYHLEHKLTEFLRKGTTMPCDEMTCLLYLSIFPEKHPIERDDLIRRWIAEDFVQDYEQGDGIFSQLINARIILSTYAADTHGRVQAYYVDELVLKFITLLADEEEFVARPDSQFPPPIRSNNNVPRPNYIIYPPFNIVALPNQVAEYPESEGFYNVRSLSVFSPHISFQLPLWRFRFLHVLYLEDCSSRDLKGIGKLIFLRYLRLSGAGCLELPEEIRKLQLLQTLDLKQTGITNVPKVVLRLPKLVRLWVSPETKLPDGIMCMKNLNELSEVKAGNITRYMKKPRRDSSSRLEVLEVSLTAGTSEESPLNGLPASLVRVRVSRPGLTVVMTAPAGGPRRPCLLDPSSSSETSPLLGLPSWVHSPSAPWQLSSLCITVKALTQADLDSLRGCGALRLLDLHVEEDTQEVVNITVSGGAFRRLVDFKFTSRARGQDRTEAGRGRGVVLNFENGAMPILQRLSLGVHVPGDSEELGLQYLASLKTADIRIDCSHATVWEVSAAEAALWVAANRGRQKSVTLDFPRDFETQMKNDCDRHARIGPWGTEEGFREYNKDDKDERPHRLESLTVWAGEVVDALKFSYLDGSGQPCFTDRWGGNGGKEYTFKLGPEEFLERVSGTIDRYQHKSKVLTIITSLTFVTNLCQHGPLGKEKGHRFHIPRQGDGRITGFFVRAGIFVDAIGVYTCADPHCVSSEADLAAINQDRTESVTLGFPRDFETIMNQDERTGHDGRHGAKSSLWGSKVGGLPRDIDRDDIPHRLESLTVWAGDVVDALKFSYLDGSGQPCFTDRWGGNGGKEYKFKLGPEEFLERVSGTIDQYQKDEDSDFDTIITSLTFVTNLCQHGPLGVERGHRFHIPRQGDNRITGFFLRVGLFVDAIGVYICAGPHCISSVTDLVRNTSS